MSSGRGRIKRKKKNTEPKEKRKREEKISNRGAAPEGGTTVRRSLSLRRSVRKEGCDYED